ncbi:GNAT family N-acetyltransferase [Maledivibacter halophilus]|uniref:Protein N-acetyltransferase, RimJ/RimL family n=1 Tax=Maledivibacter halophilus TaxID=36842 RepID=A0A1T5LEY5_9FIRM|nr:GNAT family protein [Maledivibacter halophilus]SKC73948.1 Protein N-acetyltransferase, RimJ/RimL family [Maledivibacter halophilus]
MVKIETKRLIIRDHLEKDTDSIHKLLVDEKAMYYLQDIKTKNMDQSKQNLYEAIKESKLENRTKYFFAIIMKDTDEYIGEIGFTVIIDFSYGKVVELGYFIRPKFWRRGIVTEAAREVIKYGFNEAGVIKIESGCIKENIGSERVMKKVGMIKEGEFKKHMLLDGKLYDRVEYRLLKEEWELLEKK